LSEIEHIVNYLIPNFTIIATGTTIKGLVLVKCVVTEYQCADGTWLYEKWITEQKRIVRVMEFSSQNQLPKEEVVKRVRMT